jgi:hypothetical protein
MRDTLTILHKGVWLFTSVTGKFHVEVGREDDGRWIVEIPEFPGVMVYGQTEEEAVEKAMALLSRVARSIPGSTA